MKRSTIQSIIFEIVNKEFNIILEADDLESSADLESDIDASGGGLEDFSSEVDTTDNELTGDTGVDGTSVSGDGLEDAAGDTEGEDGESSGDSDFDFGSMGGSSSGGGSSGGGFGSGSAFGDLGDSDSETDETDTESEENNTSSVEEISTDPVQAVVDIAADLRTKTGDAQQILNTVKAAIQEKFVNFDDAVEVIQTLWDTEEPVLQIVARKLILFIKGS